MARLQRTGSAPVTPLVAQRLWLDTGRWATFVDGFGHVLERDERWPEPGAKVVWQSGPAGRGRVTERIVEQRAGLVAAEMFEDQMTAVQTVAFEAEPDGCTVVVQLDYELTRGGPLRKLTDVLFIRRALAMALERTLRRFSTEAAEEASL